jgi:hypothetical protein
MEDREYKAGKLVSITHSTEWILIALNPDFCAGYNDLNEG